MDELNHLGWVVYRTYDVGGYMFGIRTNSEACGEWLDATLGEYLVTDDEADPFFSLWVPEQEEKIGNFYHVLYRESDDVLRTLDPGRLAQRLLAELATFTLRQRDDAVYMDACVVERGGVHALVPSPIIPYMRLAGRRVERELTLPLEPTIGVAPDGQLFAVPKQLSIPDDAADDLARRLGVDRKDHHLSTEVPKSVGLICAFHYNPKLAPILPLTRAMAVQALAQTVYNLPAMRGAALSALAELVDGARCCIL